MSRELRKKRFIFVIQAPLGKQNIIIELKFFSKQYKVIEFKANKQHHNVRLYRTLEKWRTPQKVLKKCDQEVGTGCLVVMLQNEKRERRTVLNCVRHSFASSLPQEASKNGGGNYFLNTILAPSIINNRFFAERPTFNIGVSIFFFPYLQER